MRISCTELHPAAAHVSSLSDPGSTNQLPRPHSPAHGAAAARPAWRPLLREALGETAGTNGSQPTAVPRWCRARPPGAAGRGAVSAAGLCADCSAARCGGTALRALRTLSSDPVCLGKIGNTDSTEQRCLQTAPKRNTEHRTLTLGAVPEPRRCGLPKRRSADSSAGPTSRRRFYRPVPAGRFPSLGVFQRGRAVPCSERHRRVRAQP